MYVRGYLQGSENGRVVTIGPHIEAILYHSSWMPYFKIINCYCYEV
jgi:hypothetical protein